MAEASFPYFSFFPALPVSKNLHLGEWSIGAPDAGVPWKSERFKALAHAHLESFERLGFRNGAFMWHRDRGFDGTKPDDKVWGAIQAAVSFAALDTNDITRATGQGAFNLITSENTDLHTQPIDEIHANISIQKGGLLRSGLVGGLRIGDPVPLPHSVVALDRPAELSQHLLAALYTALSDIGAQNNRRLANAVTWHRKALMNSSTVKSSDRIVFLKTGFESLTGESRTHQCASALRQLFEQATEPYSQWLPWEGILWSPRERDNLEREWGGKIISRTELEDWFQKFGQARNNIIHTGAYEDDSYSLSERPLSRYVGPFFWTGDRLLREAVKARLGGELLLCGLLKELPSWQAFMTEVGTLLKSDETLVTIADGSSETSRPSLPELVALDGGAPAATPSRELHALLDALECDSANKVTIHKLIGYPAPTPEGARDNAAHVVGKWEASFAEVDIVINEDERKTLEAAGAERKRAQCWTLCD